MILGIGTDLVEVVRFAAWQKYTHQQLATIFTLAEITAHQGFLDRGYVHQACLFLASRYAAKEAAYKALCSVYEQLHKAIFPWGFRYTASMISISSSGSGVPLLEFSNILAQSFQEVLLKKHLSISHEKTHAIAVVVLSLDE